MYVTWEDLFQILASIIVGVIVPVCICWYNNNHKKR